MGQALDIPKRIARALVNGGSPWGVTDVLDMVKNREAFLVDGPEGGLMVLDVVQEGDAQCLRVIGLDSTLDEVDSYWLPQLDDWAQETGCNYIQFSGRRGWVRYLKDHGWKEVATVVRKEH